MTKKEIAKQILEDNGGGVMTTLQIAEYALKNFGRYVQGDAEVLKNQFSSVMSQDIKNKKSKSAFRKIPNKQGGQQQGKFKLKIIRRVTPPSPQPTVNGLYTGKAGEHAVLSELLFYGYNASIMTVDDGIDIVASMSSQYFHIQVKTSNRSNFTSKFQFKILRDRFEQMSSGNIFYIFVLRRSDNTRHFNDFVVLSSPEIKSWIFHISLKNSKKKSFKA